MTFSSEEESASMSLKKDPSSRLIHLRPFLYTPTAPLAIVSLMKSTLTAKSGSSDSSHDLRAMSSQVPRKL